MTIANMQLFVTPALYSELRAADIDEAGRNEGGTSTGAAMRHLLLRHLPERVVDAMPNPIKAVVRTDLAAPAMTHVPIG